MGLGPFGMEQSHPAFGTFQPGSFPWCTGFLVKTDNTPQGFSQGFSRRCSSSGFQVWGTVAGIFNYIRLKNLCCICCICVQPHVCRLSNCQTIIYCTILYQHVSAMKPAHYVSQLGTPKTHSLSWLSTNITSWSYTQFQTCPCNVGPPIRSWFSSPSAIYL